MLLGTRAIGTVAYLGGVPAVLEEFCWSFSQLLIFSRETLCSPTQHIHASRVKFSDHAPARNALASGFLGEWLLQLDCDHSFDPDLLVRMLDLMNSADIDVLTGLYRYKAPPHSPVLFQREVEDGLLRPVAKWEPLDIRLFEVAAAGAGCLLVRRRVFDAIWETGEEPFDRIHPMSEDLSFFERLRKLGIKSYVAPHIECGHLIAKPVGEEEQSACSGDINMSELFAVGAYGVNS